MREVFLKMIAGYFKSGNNTFNQITIFKMVEHVFFGIVPEISRNSFINSAIANDGKFSVDGGHIDQYAIAQLGFVHIHLVEIFGRTVEHVFIAVFFDTNTYLARSLPFGILYRSTDTLLFLLIKYGHV